MSALSMEMFKSKKIIANIFPVHTAIVSGVHEHFSDGDYFITVSEDGSIAEINSETLEIKMCGKLFDDAITTSEMITEGNEKKLLIGTDSGYIFEIDSNCSSTIISNEIELEINSICSFDDGTLVISYGSDETGSTLQYFSITENKIINEIKLLPGRKIKMMHKIQGVKDKCIVSCSACNIYWLKVVDGELKLLIDQPSPDDYYYDEVWSDGKNIVKAGQSCFLRSDAPEVIKDIISESNKSTHGKVSSMAVCNGVVVRGTQEELLITNRDGNTLNRIPLPKGRFPMKVKMEPFGRILIGFQTGEVGRFEFRTSQALRFIMS